MKHVNNKKLLVTTGLLETYGKDEEILFLGEWCKPYKNNDLIQARKYTTIPYHWSDTNKRRHDYDYLGELFERVLVGLVSSLNKFHNTDYSLRYWRIILGPWLFTYVSVLWDRWENIRVAFDVEEFNSTIVMILDADMTVPPEVLPKFYKLYCEGKAEFINGSRMIYPLEKDYRKGMHLV